MSDFKARIIAELDTSQVEQKISELDGKKVKFCVDVVMLKRKLKR